MEAIYGINPIKVLLQQEQPNIKKIVIAEGRGGLSAKEIIKIAQVKKIPYEFQKRQFLDDLADNHDHQGIIALCPSFIHADLQDVINNRSNSGKFDLIVILDSIMDPQNLGSIIRTSHCLGANGIVIPSDRAASVTASVIKASAGSASLIPVARVNNLAQTIDYLKENGFWVFGADANDGSDMAELDFQCNAVLILGGEAKGIRPLLKKKCDFLLSINMLSKFDSLNVAVAAGIIQYQICISRQRPGKGQ
jgi:23S rRNA (guanosine2251-2'-O)-methyltransferase